MRKTVLIVEDETSLMEILSDTLIKNNLIVYKAKNGEEAIDIFYEKNPDLILLDINLPKKNGWDICKEIRVDSNVPIIIMTARDTDSEEIKGLELGADDYISKPFNLKILLIRIMKHLKLDSKFIYSWSGINFDFSRHLFTINEKKIEFSKKETELLEYFIKNKNRVITREMLLNEIWGYDIEMEDRSVDTLIKRVRKKLGNYSELIKTIRGVGYSFDEK